MPRVVDRVTVRERIDPRITASLFANYRSSADAVMELIDNSVDSRLPRKPLQVEIALHPTRIEVVTVGGEGMGPRDLERNYLRWGGSPKRGRALLGQYGQGGKAAIGHLGASFLVEASRPGDAIAWRFHDRDYRDRSRLKTYELEEVAKHVAEDEGYTRIRIDAVDRRVDLRRLSQRLGDTYRLLLESGGLQLSINRAPLKPSAMVWTERKDFRARAARGMLKGWIGIVDPEQRPSDFVPGVRCYRLGRLITQGEFFGHPNSVQAPGMARLIGELEVPNVALTMNKSDFDRDSKSWIEVEQRMHKLMAPLVRRLSRDEEVPPPHSALRAAEQARRLLSQALRLVDREDAFPGIAPRERPEPGEAQRERLPLEEGEPPRPRQPAAAGRRRSGFGSIVVRPLDPSIRSQLLIEEGAALVVINSRYPLFLERKGDIWYQLETAAREICKTIEGVTLAEYERRVNEIMWLAFQLRQRRRRMRTGKQLQLLS